jgi:hypothetical protein
MRHVCTAGLFRLSIATAFAQDTPRAEIFGGYSHLHIDSQGVTGSSLNPLCNDALGAGACPAGTFQIHNAFNGWNGSVHANVNHWLGVAADFMSGMAVGNKVRLGDMIRGRWQTESAVPLGNQ